METIIITGPSGSGKSFLSEKLSDLFDNSIVIKTDSYYRDNLIIRFLSIFLFDIYDRPMSIKKNELKKTINAIHNRVEEINCFQYDFNKKKSSQSKKTFSYEGKNQILIIEGIFAHRLDLNYMNTVNILCEEEKKLCLKRRLSRDQLYRGRSLKEIIKRFNSSWYLFYKNLINYININYVMTLKTSDKMSYNKLVFHLKEKYYNY